MIVRQKGKWIVKTSDGKKQLGSHDTEEQAKKQLAAIEISKKQRSKKH